MGGKCVINVKNFWWEKMQLSSCCFFLTFFNVIKIQHFLNVIVYLKFLFAIISLNKEEVFYKTISFTRKPQTLSLDKHFSLSPCFRLPLTLAPMTPPLVAFTPSIQPCFLTFIDWIWWISNFLLSSNQSPSNTFRVVQSIGLVFCLHHTFSVVQWLFIVCGNSAHKT